jgi:hypothetical protein
MNAKQALSFIRKHGVVLASAKRSCSAANRGDRQRADQGELVVSSEEPADLQGLRGGNRLRGRARLPSCEWKNNFRSPPALAGIGSSSKTISLPSDRAGT